MNSLWYDFGSVFLKGEASSSLFTTAPYMWAVAVAGIAAQSYSNEWEFAAVSGTSLTVCWVSNEGDAALPGALHPLYPADPRCCWESEYHQILMAYPKYRPSILKSR